MSTIPRLPRRSVQEAGGISLAEVTNGDWVGWFDRAREAFGDLVWDEQVNAWIVLSYEANRQMQTDQLHGPEIWQKSSGLGFNFVLPGETAEEVAKLSNFGSTRIRGHNFDTVEGQHAAWLRMFSGDEIRALGETLARPIANAVIDGFAEMGRADLHSEYAHRVTPHVVSLALGLPDDEQFIDRAIDLYSMRAMKALQGKRTQLVPSQEVFAQMSDEELEPYRRSRQGTLDYIEHFRPLVRERRSGDGDDYISRMWRNGDRLVGPDPSEADILAIVCTLFAGGVFTTMASTCNGLYLLLTRPGLEQKVREGGSRAIAAFVEETLRIYPAALMLYRRAAKDTVLAGQAIKTGEIVIGAPLGANLDPCRYPDRFEVDLERRRSQEHFTFGFKGRQACPGMGLARAQMATIFAVLLERLEDLRLDPDAEQPTFSNPTTGEWLPLHATFKARQTRPWRATSTA